MNRRLQCWEKVRYRWHQTRTIIRFVVLALGHLVDAEKQRNPPSKKCLQRRRKQ